MNRYPVCGMWTVWVLVSPSSGETRRVAKPLQIDDYRWTHEYQRIVWQGEAWGASDALGLATIRAESYMREISR